MGLGQSSHTANNNERADLETPRENCKSENHSPPEARTASMGPPNSPRAPVLELGDRAYGKKEYQRGPETSFTVVLNCSGKSTAQGRTLVVKEGMPLRVKDMKSCVEQEYSIPACCQSLVFDHVSLEDRMELAFYRVRDGDTIHVNYVSEGDVSDILGVVNHMIKSYDFIQSIQEDLNSHEVSDDLDTLINQGVHWEKVSDLPEVYFVPCSSDKAEANRNLFIQCGGLDMLQKLHTLLLQQPWSNMPLKMQHMEHCILRTYWNITAAFTVRMYVLQYPNALDSILKSFLRVKLNEKERLNVPMNIYALRVASRSELNRIACEVVYKALGALCNLAEIPECRMQIATTPGVLEQLVATLMTPSYNSIASLVAMAGMLCLAYSAETHQFLSSSTIVNGVMNACEIGRPDYTTPAQKRKKLLLLKYFANVLLAQLLTTSPQMLSAEKLKILRFMEEFLGTADYTEVREEEVTNGYKWSTLVPFMKLAYHPHSRPRRGGGGSEEVMEKEGGVEEEETRLARCCIQCGLFSLSNILLCEETREIFVLEGLLDYIVALPWIFPRHWQERKDATRLVSFLSQHMQLQPPSLINLTKAKLAALHFGLEKVLKTGSVHELLAEVYS